MWALAENKNDHTEFQFVNYMNFIGSRSSKTQDKLVFILNVNLFVWQIDSMALVDSLRV